jgi:hypothetical protein
MNQQEREQAERIIRRADRMMCVTFYQDINDQYLSHTFKFEVQINNSDSMLNPIHLKMWMEELFDTGAVSLNAIDLNEISDNLYMQIIEKYPNSTVWIKISADGGIGAFVKYDTHRPQLISV